jgi:hypothetical protein
MEMLTVSIPEVTEFQYSEEVYIHEDKIKLSNEIGNSMPKRSEP